MPRLPAPLRLSLAAAALAAAANPAHALNVLLTNDDGCAAPGITASRRTAAPAAAVSPSQKRASSIRVIAGQPAYGAPEARLLVSASAAAGRPLLRSHSRRKILAAHSRGPVTL